MDKKYTELLTKPIRQNRKPLQELLPLEQPLKLMIDPCDICNFRCAFCFQSHGKFRGSMMDEALFDTIVSQLKEFEKPINVIHLFGLGEPMLNEKLPLYVKKLRNAYVAKEISITSNGSRLTTEYSEQLVKAGLDRLTISLNGLSSEQFHDVVGVNVDFEKIYSEIRYFYKIRENCHLHVKICGQYFSKEEQERFVELFSDCTDTINIDYAANTWPGIRVADEKTTQYDIQIVQPWEQPVCPQIFYELMIHSNGDVSPCCVDYDYLTENIGNVKATTIKEIWNGKKLLQIRRQALLGEEVNYNICKNCSYPVCGATVNISPYRDELLQKYVTTQ